MYEVLLFLIAIVAGFFGSLLGIGGGMIIIPVLTLWLEIDIRYAIPASLISIIATSSGAAASFLKDHLTNIKVAVLLEVGTVFGAITGFLLVNAIRPSVSYFLFAGFLIFSALMMFRKREENLAVIDHPWSIQLGLANSIRDKQGQPIHYKVAKVRLGLVLMYFAGILSALLGIGSGVLKVLAMDGAMKLPIKVSSATSNFMIGVTAAASAGAYFIKGDIHPQIVGPVAIGIIFGSWVGARAMIKMHPQLIRKLFIALLVILAVQMTVKGLRT
ncbi:MAG: sulfite exporter TauE/SafE family protein [Bdellovibrionaceae bacterium]|nr:sulfite exporter TauE/SafE family protein [Bdellovibrio sp.]